MSYLALTLLFYFETRQNKLISCRNILHKVLILNWEKLFSAGLSQHFDGFPTQALDCDDTRSACSNGDKFCTDHRGFVCSNGAWKDLGSDVPDQGGAGGGE